MIWRRIFILPYGSDSLTETAVDSNCTTGGGLTFMIITTVPLRSVPSLTLKLKFAYVMPLSPAAGE